MKRPSLILLLALLARWAGGADAPPAGPAKARSRPAAAVIRDVRQTLLKEFEALLDAPQQYAGAVREQCRMFPEGDLFPYVLPAMAYANLAVADRKHEALARKRIARCIDLALPAVVRRVRPPGGKLEKLARFNRQATYLGQFNLALGCYRRVGGDDRYEKIHKRISDVLHAGLAARRGRPMESYPDYSWTFDTIPCLLSLALRDRHTGGSQSAEVAGKHLEWIRKHGTDKATGLPYHRCELGTGKAFGAPRGCDLSMRLALLAMIDRRFAEQSYRNYVKHFWIDRQVIAGFAEWPAGRPGREDIDSGPVVMGVGMTASGMGIGAARAMNDRPRVARLCTQMAGMRQLLAMTVRAAPDGRASFLGGIPYRDKYVTGFLMGDACLFYAVTWQDWSARSPAPATNPAGGK